MKNFLIAVVLGLLMGIVGYKLGFWYGYAKSTVEIQDKNFESPIPVDQMIAGSSASIYDHYIIENCLMKVKQLEAKQ